MNLGHSADFLLRDEHDFKAWSRQLPSDMESQRSHGLQSLSGNRQKAAPSVVRFSRGQGMHTPKTLSFLFGQT